MQHSFTSALGALHLLARSKGYRVQVGIMLNTDDSVSYFIKESEVFITALSYDEAAYTTDNWPAVYEQEQELHRIMSLPVESMERTNVIVRFAFYLHERHDNYAALLVHKRGGKWVAYTFYPRRNEVGDQVDVISEWEFTDIDSGASRSTSEELKSPRSWYAGDENDWDVFDQWVQLQLAMMVWRRQNSAYNINLVPFHPLFSHRENVACLLAEESVDF